MKLKAAATKLSRFCLVLSIFAAATVPSVQSVSWAVGDMGYVYGHPFINRFDNWGEGNPRRVAYMDKNRLWDDDLGLGAICESQLWLESKEGGNVPQGSFDFNCVHTSDEIFANRNNVGYYVGGLNCNGVTLAQCYVVAHKREDQADQEQLCDSDTFFWPSLPNCVPMLKCE